MVRTAVELLIFAWAFLQFSRSVSAIRINLRPHRYQEPRKKQTVHALENAALAFVCALLIIRGLHYFSAYFFSLFF